MTDLEKWRTFLTSFNVPFDEVTETTAPTWDEQGKRAEHALTIAPSRDTNVTGYSMFYTQIEFDADGKFVRIGLWE